MLQSQDRWALLACVLLPIGGFLVDAMVLSEGMGAVPDTQEVLLSYLAYVAAISASLWLPRWEHVLYVAVGSSAFVFVFPMYLLLSGSYEIAETVVPRRMLGLLLLWTLPIVGIRMKRGAETIQELNAELESRVAASTAVLRLVESRLNEAQRMAKIGSFEWDIENDSQWWSEERYRMVGQRPETFKPSRESFLQTVHPEDQQRVAQIMDGALTAGGSYSMEYRTLLSDGSVRNTYSQGEVTARPRGMRCSARRDCTGHHQTS